VRDRFWEPKWCKDVVTAKVHAKQSMCDPTTIRFSAASAENAKIIVTICLLAFTAVPRMGIADSSF
jgi:hypothetical protein